MLGDPLWTRRGSIPTAKTGKQRALLASRVWGPRRGANGNDDQLGTRPGGLGTSESLVASICLEVGKKFVGYFSGVCELRSEPVDQQDVVLARVRVNSAKAWGHPGSLSRHGKSTKLKFLGSTSRGLSIVTDFKEVHPGLDQLRMIVLPLKPRFADAILTGEKTVELRRAEPKIVVPTRALIYSTSPVRALVGTCIVTSVETDCLAELWQRFGPRSGINGGEFLDYFEGVGKGTALMLSEAEALLLPVPLTRLRETSQGFRPPQSFAYINAETGNELLTTAA